MWVRFLDKDSRIYRKSEVYAVINSGIYDKLVLRVRDADGDYVKLFDGMEEKRGEEGIRYQPLVSPIFSSVPEGWTRQETTGVDEPLPGYETLQEKGVRFYRFCGFSWLWEDRETLSNLLTGKLVRVAGSIFEGKLYSGLDDREGWSFVETQQDADRFLEETGGLHDSTIHTVRYESGNYVDGENMMHLPDLRHVVMELHSQWCPRIELVFDGVTALNLRPPGDNYSGDIFDSTLLVKDCTVFFADSWMETVDVSYPGTWITAYSLKWRFLGEASV